MNRQVEHDTRRKTKAQTQVTLFETHTFVWKINSIRSSVSALCGVLSHGVGLFKQSESLIEI